MRVLALTILFTAYFSDSAWSLQVDERVTVTSQQNSDPKLQKIDGVEFDKQYLESFDIFHADNIWDFVPNLNTAGGSNRLRFLQIRGIGERSEFDSVPTNSIGYYFDHIDLSGISGVVATYDLERFQVLKGPQSHIFGDSSIGGNILASSQWSFANDKSAWLGYGSQNRIRIGAKAEHQVGDEIFVKLGVQHQSSDGFIRNTFLNKDTSERDELFVNAGIYYGTGDFHIRTSHIFADQDNGYDVWSTDGNRFTTSSDRPGRDAQRTFGNSVEISKKFSDKDKVVLISSASLSDIDYSFDEDWGNDTFWNQVPAWNTDYDYNKVYDRDRRHLHSKLIYQRSIREGFVNAGLHYTNRVDDSLITSFRDGAERKNLSSRFDSKHYAAFLGLEKEIQKALTLSLNTRIEQQSIEYSDSKNFSADPSSRMYGFNASLKKDFANQSFTAVISRGYKGAGFNPEINLSEEQQFYSPESLMNYELIWRLNNKNISSKITAFYMDRKNQQIQSSSQDNPSDPSDFTVFIDNAAKSRNYGLETEVSIFIGSPFTLNITGGLLKAEFEDYSLEGVDYSGRDLAHSPVYTFAVSGVYKVTPKLSLNARLTGRDEFFFSNSHDQKSTSYALFSAGAQFKPSDKVRVSLWGRNLFDKTYAARGFFFGNEPPNFESRLYTQAGAPLEYGLDLNINF